MCSYFRGKNYNIIINKQHITEGCQSSDFRLVVPLLAGSLIQLDLLVNILTVPN